VIMSERARPDTAGVSGEKIAIVGGGIAGLFCHFILQDQKKSVWLFETADRFGGRIRTIRLDKNNREIPEWPPPKSETAGDNGTTPPERETITASGTASAESGGAPAGCAASGPKKTASEQMEFYVEFGPMRVELDKQLLLAALLDHLGIKASLSTPPDPSSAHLVPFPAYTSPASSQDPQYGLRPEEAGRTPLSLLQLALLRVITHLDEEDSDFFKNKRKGLIEKITLAAATQEPVEPVFTEWMKGLNEADYWTIQTAGKIGGVPLYNVGFWNLLSDYLSHDATMKMRDLGTFYHLLPENPNAAEWVVWWLRNLGVTERLQGIFGGMECIVDKLKTPLRNTYTDCWVKQIVRTDAGKLKLVFDDDEKEKKQKKPKKPPQEIADQEYDRVILALPRRALQDVVNRSTGAFAGEEEIGELLNSAFGFPMVKTFVVVRNRWWETDTMANQYATRIPSREIHYWRGHTERSKQGLVMVYTDRPASSFWSNYVPPGPQIDAHRPGAKSLSLSLTERLTKKVARYLNDNNLPDVTPEDIVWYGIRDWGRPPNSGANHAWRPERKYWVVMRRLADIAMQDPAPGGPSIHVCGEAYSDCHGFMEGSLRSATYVLHRILHRRADGVEPLSWLGEKGSSGDGLRVKPEYLRALRTWADQLDEVNEQEGFIDPPPPSHTSTPP
jgi:hypothetical protein